MVTRRTSEIGEIKIVQNRGRGRPMEKWLKNYKGRTLVHECTVRNTEESRGKVRVADPTQAG